MAAEFDVVVVGGGPAGLVAAVLLAERGLSTLVVERHRDFAREYRGELLMPRFAQVVEPLGLLDPIRALPHRRIDALEVHWGSRRAARFGIDRVVPHGAPDHAIWLPQTALLERLAVLGDDRRGRFELWFGADVTALRRDRDGRCSGVVVRRDDADVAVTARVTIGADGRFSRVRRLGGFELGAAHHDFDVAWFTVPEPVDTPAAFRVYLTGGGAFLALPKQPASVQCGLVLPPDGAFAALAAAMRDRDARRDLRAALRGAPAWLRAGADSIDDPRDLVLLQARVERVRRWARDGLLLIGDAAHTCSPVGAVGVAVAVHTAAVAAGVVSEALTSRRGRGVASAAVLDAVQREREPDVAAVQRVQRRVGRVAATNALMRALLAGGAALASRSGWPGPLRGLAALPRPFVPPAGLGVTAAAGRG